VFEGVVEQERGKVEKLLGSVGEQTDETNPYLIGRELGEEMTAASTVVKTGERLTQAMDTLRSLKERYAKVVLADGATWTNQSLSYTRALGDMLALATAIVKGGLERQESRGSHYRLDFPDRDDSRFLKTSLAVYDPSAEDRCRIYWRDVDASLVAPRARTYGKTDTKQSGSGKNESTAPAAI